MARKLIPCASAYKAVLPTAPGILSAHLESIRHTELAPHQPKGSGFVPTEPHGALVVPFTGGLAFSLRYDEKIVPGSVVKAELKKRVAEFYVRMGYRLGRKEQKEMREQIAVELCARALVRTKIITAFYDTKRELLILPTTSKKLKNEFMGQLVRAVDSLKTTTINVSEAKGSLTTRLRNHLANESGEYSTDWPFDEFGVGSKVILVGPGGKSSFDLDDLTNAMQGVNEAIAAGAQVSEIALTSGETQFRLSQDFMLKGIQLPVDESEPAEGEIAAFEQEAAVQLLIVANIVDDLCTLFDYKAPESDADLY